MVPCRVRTLWLVREGGGGVKTPVRRPHLPSGRARMPIPLGEESA